MATTTKKNTTKSTTKKVEEVKTVKTQPVKTKESEEVLSLKQQIEEMKKAMETLMSAKNEAIQPAQKLVVMNEEQEVGYAYVDEVCGGLECLSKEILERYFDYEAFGRDILLSREGFVSGNILVLE